MSPELRGAGYLNEEIKVALGHSQKSVTSGYGKLREGTIERIYEMISKIEYKEVNHLTKVD